MRRLHPEKNSPANLTCNKPKKHQKPEPQETSRITSEDLNYAVLSIVEAIQELKPEEQDKKPQFKNEDFSSSQERKEFNEAMKEYNKLLEKDNKQRNKLLIQLDKQEAKRDSNIEGSIQPKEEGNSERQFQDLDESVQQLTRNKR